MTDNELLINKEAGQVEFVFVIEKDIFEKARDRVYNKHKNKINVPGFRNGKAPRKIIENMYGPEIFYEDAINDVLPEEYPKAEENF